MEPKRFIFRWEVNFGHVLQIVAFLAALIGLMFDREVKLSNLAQRTSVLENAIEHISESQAQMNDSFRRLAESQAAMQAVLQLLQQNRKLNP